jgi:putative ABC transport system permease protein
MKVLDILELAVGGLVDRKILTALTIIGVLIGSAMILTLEATSAGTTTGIQAEVSKIGANTLIVRAGGANFLSGSSSSYQLSSQDVTTLSRLSNIVDVVPYYSKPVEISVGGQTVSGTMIGIDPQKLTKIYKGLTLAEGSFPADYDTTASCIGYGVAYPGSAGTQLVGLNQAVNMKIGASTTNVGFLVKGILTQYGSALFNNIDNDVFVSFNAAQLLLKTPYFSAIYVTVDNVDDVSAVQSTIENLYPANTINIMSAGSIASSLSSVSSQLTTVFGEIGGVSLVVAAVIVTCTMYMTIEKRTREIGVLKALGFQRTQILSMFLTECAIIGIAGGVLGTLVGIIVSYSIGGLFSFGPGRGGPGGSTVSTAASGPVFTTQLFAIALLLPVIVSVGAGIYPAWRGARMKPVDALKYE